MLLVAVEYSKIVPIYAYDDADYCLDMTDKVSKCMLFVTSFSLSLNGMFSVYYGNAEAVLNAIVGRYEIGVLY